MINISLKDLIYIIPDIINLFLSGFIFMCLYNWLNSKESNFSAITIWSLFISYIIKEFYSFLHSFILCDVEFNDSLQVIIYIITSVFLAIICTKIKSTEFITNLLYKINHKSIYDDIFDIIIDKEKVTMMRVYIKSSDIMYIGRYSYREEKGIDSWLVLADYVRMQKDSDKVLYFPNAQEDDSSVAINLKDIESISLIYTDGSKVWERMSGEDKKKKENKTQKKQMKIDNDTKLKDQNE